MRSSGLDTLFYSPDITRPPRSNSSAALLLNTSGVKRNSDIFTHYE